MFSDCESDGATQDTGALSCCESNVNTPGPGEAVFSCCNDDERTPGTDEAVFSCCNGGERTPDTDEVALTPGGSWRFEDMVSSFR